MTCLTCPGDLTSEGDPVPFPPSIDIDYFREKFIFETLSLPRTSGSFYSDIFHNSSFCSTCASDLLNVTHTLEEIDNLQEKVAEFKDSFQVKLVQGFQEGSFQNQIPFKIEPEVLEFKLKLITGLKMLTSQEEVNKGSENFYQPLENHEECSNSNQPDLEDTSSPEYVSNSQSDAEENPNSFEPNESEFDNVDPASYLPNKSLQLKELLIPLQRLTLPPGSITFNLKDPQYSHLLPKAKRKPYERKLLPTWIYCPYAPKCQFKTRTPNGLKYHKRLHRGEPPKSNKGILFLSEYLHCTYTPDCQFRTRVASGLKYHIDRVHLDKGFKCTICGLVIPTKLGLQIHRRTHPPQIQYKRSKKPPILLPFTLHCTFTPDCQFQTQVASGLKNHINYVHLDKGYQCGICGLIKISQKKLTIHERTHDPIPKERKKRNRDPNKPRVMLPDWKYCTFEFCDFKTKVQYGMKNHISKVHRKKINSSPCEVVKDSKSELEIPKAPPGPAKNGVKWICDICGIKVKGEKALELHLETHKEPKDWPRNHQCPECSKSFYDRVTMKGHMIACHAKERLICQHCGRDFGAKNGLNYHIRKVHEKSLPKFQCQFCSKLFLSKNSLNDHIMRIHTGLKEHLCSECPKSYTRRIELESHIKSEHRKERSKCDKCPRSFARSSALAKHIKEQHADSPKIEKSHECPDCDKSFAKRETMVRHRKLHGRQVFHCKFCNKGFRVKNYVRQHLRVVTKCKELRGDAKLSECIN